MGGVKRGLDSVGPFLYARTLLPHRPSASPRHQHYLLSYESSGQNEASAIPCWTRHCFSLRCLWPMPSFITCCMISNVLQMWALMVVVLGTFILLQFKWFVFQHGQGKWDAPQLSNPSLRILNGYGMVFSCPGLKPLSF